MKLFSRACRPSTRQTVWAIVFFVAQGLGLIALSRKWIPPPYTYAVAVAPLIAGLFYIHSMVSDIRRRMDELQLRIYLEAAAVTVGGLFLAAMVHPLFEKAHLLGPLNDSIVLFLIVGLFVAGYVNAVRRYR